MQCNKTTCTIHVTTSNLEFTKIHSHTFRMNHTSTDVGDINGIYDSDDTIYM